MKILKYIGHIFAFAFIYLIAMFVAPVLTGGADGHRVRVFIVLGVVLALEYVYMWFVARKRFFSIPASFALIMFFFMFYFNDPETADMRLGMWVMTKFLVMPYAVASCVVSTVMYFVNKKLK